MIIFEKDGTIQPNDKIVTYTRHGEVHVQPISFDGEEWWIDFAEKWNIDDMVISDADHTKEELERFEEVKELDIPLHFMEEYVATGDCPSCDKIQMLKKDKELSEMATLLADLTEMVLLGGN